MTSHTREPRLSQAMVIPPEGGGGGDARPTPTVRQTLARNTVANVLLFGVQSLVLLISFPFVLRHYGRVQYGLYATIIGILTLLQFIHLGLTLVVMKYVAEFHARAEDDRLQALIGNSYLVAAVANVVPAIVVVGATIFAADALNIRPEEHRLFILLGLVAATGDLINGFFQIARGVLFGLQRFEVQARLDLLGALGPFIAIAVTVLLDTGFLLFVATTQLALIVSGLLVFRASKRLLPGIRHRPRFHRGEFGGVMRLQTHQTLNQVAEIIFFTTDRLVLQRLFGAAVVADYSVIDRPRQFFDNVISLPLSALVPAMSKAYAEGNILLVENFLRLGTRIYLRIVMPPMVVAIVLMPMILRAWIGPEYTHLALPAELFLGALLLTAPFKVFSHLMLSKARIKEIVVARLAYAPVNLVASYLLAREIGIVGVVLPTFAFFVVIYPWVWLKVMGEEGLSRTAFIRSLLGPASVGAVAAAALFVIRQGPTPNVVMVGAMTLIALTITYAIVFITNRDAMERDLLWSVVGVIVPSTGSRLRGAAH